MHETEENYAANAPTLCSFNHETIEGISNEGVKRMYIPAGAFILKEEEVYFLANMPKDERYRGLIKTHVDLSADDKKRETQLNDFLCCLLMYDSGAKILPESIPFYNTDLTQNLLLQMKGIRPRQKDN